LLIVNALYKTQTTEFSVPHDVPTSRTVQCVHEIPSPGGTLADVWSWPFTSG